MGKTIRCIDVRTPDGKVMFSLRLYEEAVGVSNEPKPSGRTSRSPQKPQSGNGEKDSDAMTEAQRRYLFRILADQGLEGDQALAYLTERLGVETLTNVAKREASALIEELLGTAATT